MVLDRENPDNSADCIRSNLIVFRRREEPHTGANSDAKDGLDQAIGAEIVPFHGSNQGQDNASPPRLRGTPDPRCKSEP